MHSLAVIMPIPAKLNRNLALLLGSLLFISTMTFCYVLASSCEFTLIAVS